MATFLDPETGVELNCCPLQRTRVAEGPEAETVRRLAKDGVPQHRIAAMMGVHPFGLIRILGHHPRPLARPRATHLRGSHGDPRQQALL